MQGTPPTVPLIKRYTLSGFDPGVKIGGTPPTVALTSRGIPFFKVYPSLALTRE